jgi:hypothetical protein
MVSQVIPLYPLTWTVHNLQCQKIEAVSYSVTDKQGTKNNKPLLFPIKIDFFSTVEII